MLGINLESNASPKPASPRAYKSRAPIRISPANGESEVTAKMPALWIGSHYTPFYPVTVSDSDKFQLKNCLLDVILSLEYQCPKCLQPWTDVGPWTDTLNTQYTVDFPGDQVHPVMAFTAQVIRNTVTFKLPLTHSRVQEFFSSTSPRYQESYLQHAYDMNPPDYKTSYKFSVLYTAPDGQPYRVQLQYEIEGMDKTIIFRPSTQQMLDIVQSHFPSTPPISPTIEMATFLDLILGTSVRDVVARRIPQSKLYLPRPNNKRPRSEAELV
jgi:hypothetical protein